MRKENDIGTIWVCDPRFSIQGVSAQDKGLTEAIPIRFWEHFCQAEMFDEDKGIYSPACKQAPTEVLTWL